MILILHRNKYTLYSQEHLVELSWLSDPCNGRSDCFRIGPVAHFSGYTNSYSSPLTVKVICLGKGQKPTAAKANGLSHNCQLTCQKGTPTVTRNDTIRLLTAGLFSQGLDECLAVDTTHKGGKTKRGRGGKKGVGCFFFSSLKCLP